MTMCLRKLSFSLNNLLLSDPSVIRAEVKNSLADVPLIGDLAAVNS